MGILKTVATVAVASSVHGRIQRRQQTRWAAQDAAAGNPVPMQPAGVGYPVPEQPYAVPTPAAAAPAPPAPSPTAAPAMSMIEELRQLGELRDAGILTSAEFDAQKARVLANPR